jgi:hypothetical protein
MAGSASGGSGADDVIEDGLEIGGGTGDKDIVKGSGDLQNDDYDGQGQYGKS